MYHFISFPFLIAVARTFQTMLSKSAKGEHSFSFSPLNMMIAVRLLYMAFAYSAVLALCIFSGEFFFHKRMLNFIKSFFCIYLCDHIVLQFVDVVYHIDWFVDIIYTYIYISLRKIPLEHGVWAF